MDHCTERNFTLRAHCTAQMRKRYGNRPPEIVTRRLSRELDIIMHREYTSIFLRMQKLAEKSRSDGYSVMPRGALGSSFAAFLLGIAEGNPLPPHYRCATCFHTDFEPDRVCYTGFDLPNKVCPRCGAPLKKDGMNIPFETFVGLNGEKDVEFSLNFSGEYADILLDGMRLPKLKILGHHTPTLLHKLQVLTGVDPSQIPFDDPKILSLFSSPDALGIPAFDSRFISELLSAIKPKGFSDLICILGLAHGAGAWTEDTEKRLKYRECSPSSVICCKDDIWNELRRRGIPEDTAFDVMETVGNGCVAAGQCTSWANRKRVLQEYGLPAWYIRSCEKIRYLPPKAHITAYAIAAWRIAYFKRYYPQEFYAAL